MTEFAPLDNPIWHALEYGNAWMSIRKGAAARFPADVSPFVALETPSEQAFSDLRELVAPSEHVALMTAVALDVPSDWIVTRERLIDQMICTRLTTSSELESHALDQHDAKDVLNLAKETEPGPFLQRTMEMGKFIGVRTPDGRLAAMAGHRLSLSGFTEISAVCTSPKFRGQGLSKGLVSTLASRVLADTKIPFLHVKTENGAKFVYEKVGFKVRKSIQLTIITRAN